jgi:hypothetical protein
LNSPESVGIDTIAFLRGFPDRIPGTAHAFQQRMKTALAKTKSNAVALAILAQAGAALLLTGCDQDVAVKLTGKNPSNLTSAGTGGGGGGTTNNNPAGNPPPICDPLAGGSGGTTRSGLLGELYYAASGTGISKVDDVIRLGTKANASIYMGQVNAPVHSFSQGFSFRNGQQLEDDHGNVVLEWFALKLRSRLVPSTTSGIGEGDYQFMLVSDDGSQMTLTDSGFTLIDNDGTHAARNQCSSLPIALRNGAPIPIELKYFQGPRYEIAFQLYVRPWQQGNSGGCSPTSGSGWTIVPGENFQLEASAPDNPCN